MNEFTVGDVLSAEDVEAIPRIGLIEGPYTFFAEPVINSTEWRNVEPDEAQQIIHLLIEGIESGDARARVTSVDRVSGRMRFEVRSSNIVLNFEAENWRLQLDA